MLLAEVYSILSPFTTLDSEVAFFFFSSATIFSISTESFPSDAKLPLFFHLINATNKNFSESASPFGYVPVPLPFPCNKILERTCVLFLSSHSFLNLFKLLLLLLQQNCSYYAQQRCPCCNTMVSCESSYHQSLV